MRIPIMPHPEILCANLCLHQILIQTRTYEGLEHASIYQTI